MSFRFRVLIAHLRLLRAFGNLLLAFLASFGVRLGSF